jgi:hypothetical protein
MRGGRLRGRQVRAPLPLAQIGLLSFPQPPRISVRTERPGTNPNLYDLRRRPGLLCPIWADCLRLHEGDEALPTTFGGNRTRISSLLNGNHPALQRALPLSYERRWWLAIVRKRNVSYAPCQGKSRCARRSLRLIRAMASSRAIACLAMSFIQIGPASIRTATGF